MKVNSDHRKRARRSFGAVLGLCLAVTGLGGLSQAQAAAPPRKPAARFDPRDFNGVWENPEGQERTFTGKYGDVEPPLNPEWLDYWRKVQDRQRKGQVVWSPTVKCLPPGMPRTVLASYAVEFVAGPKTLYMLGEYFGETRRIYMDGRKFPPDDELEPSFGGYSIGRWEGDTLVIETRGLRYDTLIDVRQVPHSDQLRLIERFRRVGPDELDFTLTAIDPVVFTEPYVSERKFVRSAPDYFIREFVCADSVINDKYEPTPDDDFFSKPPAKLKTKP